MYRKAVPAAMILACSSLVHASTQILVPAYFDPSSTAYWNTLTASVSAEVPITAIMNPDNGPTASVDSAYTAAIASFEAAGGKVVGYIYTTDGKRALSAAEKDVATYKSEYPNIDGIFVDEMATSNTKLSYYTSLYSYIKTENPNWQVIGNPGTNTLSTYLSAPPAADMLVTFENGSGYSSYSPSTWESSYNASSFANIVYGVSGAAAMQTDLSQAAIDHAGNVYFSDAAGSNPYDTLPTYWSQEVAAVQAQNLAALKSTYVLSGAGNFNSAASWSNSIPNGIDAEADFTTSITASHTVYSDTPITLGKIVFDNTNTYVLAGAGSLTMQTSSGSAMVDAQDGTQKITLPMTIASSTVLNADGGANLIIGAPVVVNTGQTLSETGAGTVTFQSTVTVQAGGIADLLAGSSIDGLALGVGSDVAIIAGSSTNQAVVQVDSLTLTSTSRLDLQTNGMIIHNGDVSTVTSEIQSGLASGSGIVSSSADSGTNHLSTIGVILNSDNGTPIYTSFDGNAVLPTDVLMRYTSVGDANLDGTVDGSDYTLIDNGFNNHLTGWYNGDFNYQGVVDGSDYTLIDNAYNATLAANTSAVDATDTEQIAITGGASVPEPGAGLSMLGLMAAGMRHRRYKPAFNL
jgi:hypothetical protein